MARRTPKPHPLDEADVQAMVDWHLESIARMARPLAEELADYQIGLNQPDTSPFSAECWRRILTHLETQA